MSRRTLSVTEGTKNPATKFLEWKSNEKAFSYWDKEKEEEVLLKLPLKFQFLEDFHTVKGWHDDSESRIYSNEVKFISKEPLRVSSFKGGQIAEGIYKDIRSRVKDAGGVYYKSVYLVDEDGNIVNMQIKGSVVSAYTDFMDSESNKVESYWIEINEVENKKKGATKYSVPIFEIGDAYTKSEYKLVDEKYIEIANYHKGKSEPNKEDEDTSEDDDDFDIF